MWNAKYPAFILTRYSPAQQKFIQVGKPRSDIREALKAAARADARDGYWMTFVDVPRATDAVNVARLDRA